MTRTPMGSLFAAANRTSAPNGSGPAAGARNGQRMLGGVAALALMAAGCASSPKDTPTFDGAGFSPWTESAPAYRFSPGDEVELTVFSAPAHSGPLIVGPDGRIHPPFADPVMAAGRTVSEVEEHVRSALDQELSNPRIDLRPTSFASQRIFVGGQVASPGVFELPGQIGALEAVMLAGGFTDGAATDEIVILRRGDDGRTMAKVVDLDAVARGQVGDLVTLQRFDVILAPRSDIASWNLFVRQFIRDSLPVDFNLFYDVSND